MNNESKAFFPESREGASSTCEICGQVSYKLLECFDRVVPLRAKVFRFKCENLRCKGRAQPSRTQAKTGRIWEVEKILEGF